MNTQGRSTTRVAARQILPFGTFGNGPARRSLAGESVALAHDAQADSGSTISRSASPAPHLTETTPGHNFAKVRVERDAGSAQDGRKLDAPFGPIVFQSIPPVIFSPKVDARLPALTPAWSENGRVHLSGLALLSSTAERKEMLRHETIHSYHQRLAPPSEAASARRHAEDLATRGAHDSDRLHLADFLRPAPPLLAYPPQTYSPWTNVWVGLPGLIGEIIEGGVSVRIHKTYDELGIGGSAMNTYVCGDHQTPAIPPLVEKMKRVARQAAKMNQRIPADAKRQRITRVVVTSKESATRVFAGEGLILLTNQDFEGERIENTIAHEGSHAIFEFHSVRKGKPEDRVPDALALSVADLYTRLAKTQAVPLPTAKFDPKHPPPLKAKADAKQASKESMVPTTIPAGYAIVFDTLWGGSGGHPWDGVDEFFASAYAGFLRQPDLMKEMIKHYQKADAQLASLAQELLTLLAAVDDPKKYEKLSEPKEPTAAKTALSSVKEPLDFSTVQEGSLMLTEGRLDWLLDPTKMPTRENVYCQGAKPTTPQKSIDELMDEATKPSAK